MRVSLLITLLGLSATFVICQADDTPYKSRRGPSSYSRRRESDSGGEAADLQGNQDQATSLSSRRGQLRSSAVPYPTKQTRSDTDSRTERGRRRFGSAAQRGSEAEDSSGPRIEASTRHQEQPVPSERTVIRSAKRRPVTATQEHQSKPEIPDIEEDDNYPEHFKQQLKSGKSLPAASSKEPRPQSVKPTETSRPRTSSGIARRLPRPHTTSDPDPAEPQTSEPKKNVLTKPRVSPGFARGRLPSRPSSTSSDVPPNEENEKPKPKLSTFARGRLAFRPNPTSTPESESSEEPPILKEEKPKLSSGFTRGRLASRPSPTSTPESESSEEPPNVENEKPKPKFSSGFTRGRLPSRSTTAPEPESLEEPQVVKEEKTKLSSGFARGRLASRPSPTSASRSQALNEASKLSLTRGSSRSHTTAAPELEEDGAKPRTSSGFARGRSLSHRAHTTAAPESVIPKLSPSSLRSRTSLLRETAKLRTTSKPKVEATTEFLDTKVDAPAEPDEDKQKTEDDETSETKDSSSTPVPEVRSSTPEEEEQSVSEESVQSTPRTREYVRRKNIINYSTTEQVTEAATSTSTARTREYVRRKYTINYSSTEKTLISSTESAVNTPRTHQYVRRKNKINYSSEEQTTAAEPVKNHRSREFTRGRHSTRSKKEQVLEVSTTTESNLRLQADSSVDNIPKSEDLEPTEITIGETTVSNTPRSRYSAKHRRLELPREGKSVNITAIKSKHRYSSKFRSTLFLAKATSTPSPNDVAQTTEMSEQEAIRRLREKFPLLSSRVPNKRPRWFTSTTPISDLVAAPASESPSLLTSTDPIEPNDYTEANYAQETMAEPIVDASFTTVIPMETSTPERKPTMISFVLHTSAAPVEETSEERKYPESEAGTINSDIIDNSLITTTESTNEIINNFDNEIHTETPRNTQEVEQTSKYATEANLNQVTEPTTEHIVSSTSRFILKNGILLLNTEPTPMKTDKKSNIGDQSLEDVLLNQIVSAVAAATNEVTTSYPSLTQHSTLSSMVSNINSTFNTSATYKPIEFPSPSSDSTTHVPITYASTSTSSTAQTPVAYTSEPTSSTTQAPVTYTSTPTSSTTQMQITQKSPSISSTAQLPIAYTSTATSTTTQVPYTYPSTSRMITTQGPRLYATTTTQQVPLMYQPRFAMRIPIAPPGTMSSTPSSAIKYHFILKATPESSTNIQYNSINPVIANKNTSFDKSPEIKNTAQSTLNNLIIPVTLSTISLQNTTTFQINNEIEVTRSNVTSSLGSTVASTNKTSSPIVSLPNATSPTTSAPSTTKHATSATPYPTIQRVATTPQIPIALTTQLISTASTPFTSPQTTAISTKPIPVTTPLANTLGLTAIRVPASTPLITPRVTATPTTSIPNLSTMRISTPTPVTTPRVTAVPSTPIPVTPPHESTSASPTLRVLVNNSVTIPRATSVYTTHTLVTTPRVNTSDLTKLPATTNKPITTPRVNVIHTTHIPVTATTIRLTTPIPVTTPRATIVSTSHATVTKIRANTPAQITVRVTTPIPVTTPRSTTISLTPTRATHITTPVQTTSRSTTPTTVTTTRAATPVSTTPSKKPSATSVTTPIQTTPRITTPASTTHDIINDITSFKENNVKPTDWTYRNIQNVENSASSSILPLTNEASDTSSNLSLKVESPKDDPVGLTSQDLLILELLSRQRLGNNIFTTAQPHDGLLLSNVLESQRETQKSVAPEAPSYSLPVNPEPPRAATADATWFAILRQLGSASFGLPAPQQLPVRTTITPPRATSTTTTLAPGTNQQESQRTPKRQRIKPEIMSTEAPESVNLHPSPQAEAGNPQSALVTVAINVTRTVAGLMGRVIQGAARTVSAVVSDSGRVFANYLQTWQIPAAQ